MFPGSCDATRHSERDRNAMMIRKDKVPASLELNLGEEGKVRQESSLPVGNTVIARRQRAGRCCKNNGRESYLGDGESKAETCLLC